MNAAARALETGWCTFRVDGRHYGVELDRVHEVLRALPLTPVPLAPPAVAGLLNLRGQIVPVVDLRVVFALEPRRDRDRCAHVVVRGGDGPVSLLVESIGDVYRPGSGPGEGATAGVPGAGDSLCAYTLPLADSILVVLDLDRVVEQAFDRPGREPDGQAAAPPRRQPGDRT